MRKRSILLLALGVAGCGLTRPELAVRPIGASPAPMDAGDYYALGKQQLAAGNFGLAVDYLRKAARNDPRSTDALNALGVAYDRLGRFDLSRNYYERALALEPKSAVVLNNLGYSLVLQGKAEEGKLLLARAHEAADPEVRRASAAIMATLTAPQLAAPLPQVAQAPVRGRPWVERTSAGEQTLVLEPREDVTRAASRLGVEPKLISVASAANPASLNAAARINLDQKALSELALSSEVVASGAAMMPKIAIINGVGRSQMAARMGSYLASQGVPVAGLGNIPSFNRQQTELVYSPANREAARTLAASLPFKVRLVEQRSAPAVRLILGRNAVRFDQELSRA